jgi:perosamine synthetase
MNPEPEGTINGAWMPTVVFDEGAGVTVDKLQSAFKTENIDARVFFHPLSSLPMFEGQIQNQNAWKIPGRAINLPSFHDVALAELDRVEAVVLGLLEETYEVLFAVRS